VDADGFAESVRIELGTLALEAGPSRLDTIYLGGGTPSQLGAAGITKLFSTLRDAGATAGPDAEVTIETNPDDVDQDFASAIGPLGINRVSLGIQSFDDSVLAWMHRVHDGATAKGAFRILRGAGLANISLDLIYGLPESVGRSWERDLDAAIELDPEHVSVYGLTKEPRTPYARWADAGKATPATDAHAESQFMLAHQRLTAAGYEHYEVSNYAKPGRRSRHNSAYWTRAPYLGVGPSAHSFDGLERRWNVPHLAAWEAALREGRTIVGGTEVLSPAQVETERRYLGLRTTAGCAVPEQASATASRFAGEGWGTLRDGWLTLTPSGWMRLDAIAAALEPRH